MDTKIDYTELYVRDGDANTANGAVVQYWVAVNHLVNIKTHIATYNGEPAGDGQTAPINGDLAGLLKKYSKVALGGEIPKCFNYVGTEPTPAPSIHSPPKILMI